MNHYLNLHPRPFMLIKDGMKTIELRLLDEKRREISVGDTLIFINTEDDSDKLLCKVKALYTFASFTELYESLPLEKCGYLPHEIAAASPTDMNIYYSLEKQAKYGVVGIEIELIKE